MGIRFYLSGYINRLIKYISLKLGVSLMPIYFNGKWLFIDIDIWQSPRMKYEPYMADFLITALGKGDNVLDIGAHYGLWSFYCARLVGEEGSVSAFEPSPTYDSLTKASSRYACVETYNIGLGDDAGEMTFYAQGKSTSGSFVRNVTEINHHHQPEVPVTRLSVPVRTLDKIIEEISVIPDFIKVDVEGFEVKVLLGSINHLSRGNSIWVIEVHPVQIEMSGNTEDQLFDLLREHGYRHDVINRNDNGIYTIAVSRNEVDLL